MEDGHHPASILTTKSSLPSSRFAQKLAHVRGKFSWFRRKDENKGPYSQRSTRSLDVGANSKRYMSQPSLGMKPYPTDVHRTRPLVSDPSPSPSSSSHSPVRMSQSDRSPPVTRQQANMSQPDTAPAAIEGLPPPSIGSTPRPANKSKERVKPPDIQVYTTSPSHSETSLVIVGDPSQLTPKETSKVAAGASTINHPRSATLPTSRSFTRRPAPHLDGLPPTQRFSLGSGFTDNERGMARLSPFVITRQAPMPIMNLPTLRPATSPAPDPSASSSRGFRRAQSVAKLKHMPSLPLQGSIPEPTGNAGDDDDHDITIEEDDDDEETENDNENFEDALEEAGSDDGDDEDLPRPSSSALVTTESSLSEVEAPRMDVSLQGPNVHTKDKGKAREDPVEGTPTIANPIHDYFSTQTSGLAHESTSPTATPRAQFTPGRMPGNMRTVPMPWAEPKFVRPGIYQHASKSMIDIISPSKRNSILRDDPPVKGLDGDGTTQRRPLLRQETSEDANEPLSDRQKRLSAAPAYETLFHPLRRRQSLPTFNMASPPPPYPSFAPFHKSIIMPREDEGREKLPCYTNDIYLRAVMPRKMEFSKPGVQARDRKWRRVLCELDGTVFRVYKCPPGVSGVGVLSEWWESKVGVGDVSSANPNPNSGKKKEEEKVKSFVIGQRSKLEEEMRSMEATQTQPSRLSVDETNSTSSSSQLRASSSPSPMPPIMEHESSGSSYKPEGSRSRLRNLLKPSRSHGRSQSEAVNSMQPRSPPGTPRASFSESRSTGSRSSASPSPPEPSRLQNGSKPSLVLTNRSSDGTAVAPDPDASNLIRAYTLQNAESGLGNDYIKRKCVIRVRMEGEQFLLQGKDIPEVIEWIEGFQASANVALDLDSRPMPKGPLFPRRRRRRAAQQTSSSTPAQS